MSRWIAVISGLLMLARCGGVAYATDHGFDQSNPVTQWFETVPMPDTQQSCCGLGDAYEADVWTKNPDGSYEATITDGSGIVYPDGTTRAPIANGTVIHVPAEKVNPPKDGNPTGHGVIFMAVYKGALSNGPFCFILLPLGS